MVLDRHEDQDIFARTAGFYPGSAFGNAVYKNHWHGNRWTSAPLAGVQSNRAANRARLKLELSKHAMKDGSRRSAHPREQRWEFEASSLEQKMWVGRPTLYGLWRYAGLLPGSGGCSITCPLAPGYGCARAG